MRLIIRFIAALMVFTVTPAFADSDYSEVYVFGDSLSDPGNVFALTGQVSVRPYVASLIPDAPYPIGRNMTFSNGPTWIQVYGKATHQQGPTGPALRTTRFTNYAFAGARAADSADNPFDMGEQVAQFMQDQNNVADPSALYVVWFGGNDLRDALLAYLYAYETTIGAGGSEQDAQAAGGAAAQAVIGNSIGAYISNLLTLAASGATNYLILNAPNVGVAPAVSGLGGSAAALATILSVLFNQALDEALDTFELISGANTTRIDAFSIITGIVMNPALYGLENTTEACITPGVTKGAICDSPDLYLFWDGLHPTRVGHELVATALMDELD